MKRILFAFLLVTFLPAVFAQENPADDSPYVVMVSFDGFRTDYVERWDLPNFKRLIAEGAAAESMLPAYPSYTFPNHYTLVTGMYPGNHGLVANTFYQPSTALLYTIGNRERVEEPAFYGGLPLWQYVQEHGMKSASFFWVGSEAPIAGRYPNYFKIFDYSVPNQDRITQVLEWLALPSAARPHFITLYFGMVDGVAHDSGPLSPEVEHAALEADRLVGRLLDELQDMPVPVNLIVTSDHGMYPVQNRQENLIDISTFGISQEQALVASGQTLVMLYVDDPRDITDIYNRIRQTEEHFRVYLKQDTPAHWHYSEHENIGDIVLAADPGYVFIRSADSYTATDSEIGVHGYDPLGTDALHAVFYAWGPGIRSGMTIPAFENIHVFPLVTELLGLPPRQGIDGDAAVLSPILQQHPALP